ncbi:MAG: DUF3786 domain-containing protein [Chloroflexi bacterium]|nr:DUF3786 domain-containing protein [Chloroflexota bacterium]
MAKSDWLLGDSPNPLAGRVDEIRLELGDQDPSELALRTGTLFTSEGGQGGVFQVSMWGQEVLVDFPAFTARYTQTDLKLNTFELTMLAYYFHLSDGTPQSGQWIAFTELPDGKFYTQAFQNYTGQLLIKAFGNNAEAFEQAALKSGGRKEFFANISFSFQALPRVALMVACWLGDEDFPPSYRVLFDSAAGRHLSTDGCAILGSTLTRRIIKAKQSSV